MRERFDAGVGLMAIGAVMLLVSLFIDWYDPGGDAWAVFEWVDVFLAAGALLALAALVSRDGRLANVLPWVAVAALGVVAVQLIDLPPAARGADREAGAWLALGASALMTIGAGLAISTISVTVDVRGRDHRRRTRAVDARETHGSAPTSNEPTAQSQRSLFGRRASAPAPTDDPDRTQSLDPIDPDRESER